jgi:hypothetical protein
MKAFFARLAGIPLAVWNFYAPILKATAASGLTELLPLAMEVVAMLAMSGKSGADKRAEAIVKITDAAQRQGVAVTENLVRLTIEAALTRLKSDGLK